MLEQISERLIISLLVYIHDHDGVLPLENCLTGSDSGWLLYFELSFLFFFSIFFSFFYSVSVTVTMCLVCVYACVLLSQSRVSLCFAAAFLRKPHRVIQAAPTATFW